MSKANEKNLKEMLAEFDQIVLWFDAMNEEFDVEQATQQYAKGAQLAEAIKQRLAEAKAEIEIVNQ